MVRRMSALRLLYIVPLYIFGCGVFVGMLTVLCIPLIRRYVERNADKASKRMDALREQRNALLNPPTPLQQWLLDDARKRAN